MSFLYCNNSSGFKSYKQRTWKIIPKEGGCADGWVGMSSSAAPFTAPNFKAALKNLTSIMDSSSGPNASLSVFITKQLSQINLK